MSLDVIDKIFKEVPFPGWALEHAAVTETSLMMYFAPHLVREDKIVYTLSFLYNLIFFDYTLIIIDIF